MAEYCTLVLYFHSPAARENMAAHSCNIQPYCLLTHQIIYIYIYIYIIYKHIDNFPLSPQVWGEHSEPQLLGECSAFWGEREGVV